LSGTPNFGQSNISCILHGAKSPLNPLTDKDDSCRAFQDFVVKRRKWFRRNLEGEGRRSVGAAPLKRAAGIAHCGSPGSKMDCLKNLPQPRYAELKNTPGRT
jgi:hypothetical protein